MKHDISKEVNTYGQLTKKRTVFSLSDIAQIYESAKMSSGETDTAVAIMNALAAGYSVGYRAGVRKGRKADAGRRTR